MPKYRCEVTRVSVFMVDEDTPELARCKPIALAQAGIRPAYRIADSAEVDAVPVGEEKAA